MASIELIARESEEIADLAAAEVVASLSVPAWNSDEVLWISIDGPVTAPSIVWELLTYQEVAARSSDLIESATAD